MSETKIQLDPIQTAAVACHNDVERRIKAEAARFQRIVQKRIKKKTERWNRESVNNMSALFSALGQSLGVAVVPDKAYAWVRPDGVGELVIPGPDPRKPEEPKTPADGATLPGKIDAPASAPSAPSTEAASEPDDGKILPMPVGASNGSHA